MRDFNIDQPFDYIVVGGGTSGLVIASRLSEDSRVRVLVVEAGGDNRDDPLVNTPGLSGALLGNKKYDWCFDSVPQEALNNRRVAMDRGKGLGGSSAINFMVAVFPSRSSIDYWGKLGNNGWSYDTLEPYLRKFATRNLPTKTVQAVTHMDGLNPKFIGHGPIQLSFGELVSPVNTAWAEANEALGFKMAGDPSNGTAIGAFYSASTVNPENKTRSYAANTYYSDEVRQRENLVVLTNAFVSKIDFEGTESDVIASGVQLSLKDGSQMGVRARLEVVLAAGAIQTPQILELSGVGSKSLLETFDIPIVIANENVGENLQDHPMTCLSYEIRDGLPSIDLFRDQKLAEAALGQYMIDTSGPLGSTSCSVSYLPMVDENGMMSAEDRKALFDGYARDYSQQITLLEEMLSGQNEPALSMLWFPNQINVDPEGAENFGSYIAPAQPETYYSVLSALSHPFSRGNCHIQSANVRVAPLIDPKYMTHPADIEIAARAVMFSEKLIATEPLPSTVIKPGGARMPELVSDTLEKAREAVRKRTVSNMHMCGTCAMMPREQGGVVDNKLRVYDTRNLRIADASIMPLVPLGNIQPVVYAVAEMAADIIKNSNA